MALRDRGNPFGDGHAADRIVTVIARFLRGERVLLQEEEQFGSVVHALAI
jgi:hypothetical protein